MRLISWNVNGLRACLNKGFLDFCALADADVICLQETKMRPEQASFALEGYQRFWNSADKAGYSGTAVFTRRSPLSVTYDFGDDIHRHEGRVITAEFDNFYLVCCYTPNSKDQLARLDYRMEWEDDIRAYLMALDAEKKGYSGTAVFTRIKPLGVSYNLGHAEHDSEGRVITLEFEDFYLVCVYTPNSQDGLRRLDYRMQWEDAFRDYLVELDHIKPVVVCGDMNVAHEEIDLKNPKTNRMNPGFTDEERGKMTELLDAGFTDTFRYLYPDLEGAYTWWSFRAASRERNVGWRIDYFLCSNRLAERIDKAYICPEIMGSDHCPVGLDLK